MRLSGADEQFAVPLQTVGQNVRAVREAIGLTKSALAEAAGVDRATVGDLEAGRQNPSVIVLLKISRALGVPIHHLLAAVE